MLPRVLILRVRGRLTQAGHRGDAGIGRREHLGPLGLGPGGEHLAEFRAQPRPSVTVVLVGGWKSSGSIVSSRSSSAKNLASSAPTAS